MLCNACKEGQYDRCESKTCDSIIRTAFLRTVNERNVYDFTCACGTHAELGVPIGQKVVCCPDCGSIYAQQIGSGVYVKPILVDVLITKVALL